ncbi:MAG: MFS transporter [Thermomicrobiales bacterium]
MNALSASTHGTRRPIYALLAANTISQIGNSLTFMAIPWFVLATTGSASRAGVTVAMGTVPMIIAGVFGGAVVDRLGYRRASILSDLASGISVLLIPLLYQTIGLAFWQLLVLVFAGSILDAPGMLARRSLFPDLVEDAGGQLERANAAYSVTRRIAGLLSPPLAGILIATLGASSVLWIDAATFAMSAGIVGLAIPSVSHERDPSAASGLSRYLREVRDGFEFVRRDRLLFWIVTTFSLGSLLAEPLYAIVLPVYAREEFGSAVDLGFIFAALGAGSLVGNGVYALLGPRLPRSLFFIGGFAVRALTFWVLIAMPSWWVVAGAIFVEAVIFEPINPLTMTIEHERVPAGMRGRVFGVRMALGFGTLPLGILVYGYLLEGIGLHDTLIVLALVNAALPLAMLAMPALRAMNRRPPGPPIPRGRGARSHKRHAAEPLLPDPQ